MNVYILLTAERVRTYTTRARAFKVYCRAQRMGVKVEYIPSIAKHGDPYPKHETPVDAWGGHDGSPCEGMLHTADSAYARAEAGFADSGRD